MKICTRCKIEKELSEFHKYSNSKDGHKPACKVCLLEEHRKYIIDNNEYVNILRRKAPKKKRIINPIDRKVYIDKYRNRNPEKRKCESKIWNSKINKPKEGYNLHHWSYNIEHALDVIELAKKDHKKAHRFIIYDQERFMYRRYDTNELLDSKERHLAFITEMINTKEN